MTDYTPLNDLVADDLLLGRIASGEVDETDPLAGLLGALAAYASAPIGPTSGGRRFRKRRVLSALAVLAIGASGAGVAAAVTGPGAAWFDSRPDAAARRSVDPFGGPGGSPTTGTGGGNLPHDSRPPGTATALPFGPGSVTGTVIADLDVLTKRVEDVAAKAGAVMAEDGATGSASDAAPSPQPSDLSGAAQSTEASPDATPARAADGPARSAAGSAEDDDGGSSARSLADDDAGTADHGSGSHGRAGGDPAASEQRLAESGQPGQGLLRSGQHGLSRADARRAFQGQLAQLFGTHGETQRRGGAVVLPPIEDETERGVELPTAATAGVSSALPSAGDTAHTGADSGADVAVEPVPSGPAAVEPGPEARDTGAAPDGPSPTDAPEADLPLEPAPKAAESTDSAESGASLPEAPTAISPTPITPTPITPTAPAPPVAFVTRPGAAVPSPMWVGNPAAALPGGGPLQPAAPETAEPAGD